MHVALRALVHVSNGRSQKKISFNKFDIGASYKKNLAALVCNLEKTRSKGSFAESDIQSTLINALFAKDFKSTPTL